MTDGQAKTFRLEFLTENFIKNAMIQDEFYAFDNIILNSLSPTR